MAKPVKETSPLLTLEKEEGFDLWQEHAQTLKSWDDLSLSRWLNQTLGQLKDFCWRASHPLVAAYRLGSLVAHKRDLWNRHTFAVNPDYKQAACCGSPVIPFISFEACSHGIYCSCCGEIIITVEELPKPISTSLQKWSKAYETYHQVAHWPEENQKRAENYQKDFDKASRCAIPLLGQLGYQIAPKILTLFPAVIWEDSDHCLDIIPEDIFPPEE